MRTRPLLAVLVVVLSTVVTVGGEPGPALAAPPGCVAASNGIVLACEYTNTTARPLGAIGLLGDSVLLGSSPGMSTPALPALLATRGWGPMKMTTSLGMRTYNPVTTSASAYHVLGKWKAAGFNPRVIVVNLGANHFLDCTASTYATCQAKIVQLMDRIAAVYPAATVWWAKTNARSLRTGSYDSGMLGWNKALDAVAKARPSKLVVWDWPKAVVDGKFAMDPPQIHPSGAAQYIKRSTLIADHVTAYTPARFNGRAVVPPALPTDSLGFTVADVVTDVFDSGASPIREFAPRQVDLNATTPGSVPAGATAVAFTLTVRNPSAAGWAWAYRCDQPGAPAPRVYFAAGQQRSVQALVRLTGASSVCVAVSNSTADTLQAGITLSLQGSFAPTTGDTLTLTSPPALATVTTTGPSVRTFTVGGTGTHAMAVAITVAGRTAGGTITAYRCGDSTVPTAFQLSYGPSETHTATAFVPATNGQVCLRINSLGASLPSVSVGVLGRFSSAPTGLRFRPITPTRILDLRPAARKGGWYGRHVAQQVLAFTAGKPGTGIRAVSGTVTAYTPLVGGTYTAYARPKVPTAAAPPVAALQVRAGVTSAASLTTAVDAAGGGIALRSSANAITAFDVTGYWTTT